MSSDEGQSISQVSGEENIEFSFSARVSVRHYFATQHLWSARHFAKECARIEGDLVTQGEGNPDFAHRSLAVGVVFSSVAFLEALVNEVLQDAANGLDGQIGPRAVGIADPAAKLLGGLWENGQAFERASIEDKYQVALLGVGAEKFKRDHNPLRPVLYLIKLRNALVHFKPETLDSEAEHVLERKLKPLIRENQQPIGIPWFPNKLLGAGLADWACTSASNFADEWATRVGLTHSFLTEMQGFPAP